MPQYMICISLNNNAYLVKIYMVTNYNSPSVCISVGCVDKNYNIGHNSNGRTSIFHICIPYDKTFNMVR